VDRKGTAVVALAWRKPRPANLPVGT
jgi:hypothetical protein